MWEGLLLGWSGNHGGEGARATVGVSAAVPDFCGSRWRAGGGHGKVLLLEEGLRAGGHSLWSVWTLS